MKFRTIARLGSLVLLLSMVLIRRPDVSAQGNPLVWSQVAGLPISVTFQDVVMYDVTTAFAVGSDGAEGVIYTLQYANGRWTGSLDYRFNAPVNALAVIGPDNIWVVGDNGLLAHKTAAGWSVGSAPVSGTALQTIQMFGDGSEGWAAGYVPVERVPGVVENPVLLHYTGGAWQRDTSVAGDIQLASLHFAPGAGWLVSDSQIWRNQNGGWQTESYSRPCEEYPSGCYPSLESVRAIDADEAWAVGYVGTACSVCSQKTSYILHRSNNTWEVFPLADVVNRPLRNDVPMATSLHAVTFADAGNGLAVGTIQEEGVTTVLMVFRHTDGVWSNEPLPLIEGELNAVNMLDARHALAVGSRGVVLGYGYGQQPQAQPNPTAREANPNDPDGLYFENVGHGLLPPFKGYWEHNGGLAVFGYPLTRVLAERGTDDGRVRMVQYLERQRYEYHRERNVIMLGLLGVELLTHQGRDWRAFPKADPNAAHYYPETGQAIAPEFWGYWSSHGLDLDLGQPEVTSAEALALFGYPISPPQLETNSSGDTVLTQWFERARFEYHPNNPAEYRVLLGLLGAELVAARGW
ncbi:MAG: hypothetical protein H0T53_07625 [Herpetosiphonaceae bacterium]|nr:hypothetical protein [Herpetosiphonaceae bacterium]